jgi:hypothetical protein
VLELGVIREWICLIFSNLHVAGIKSVYLL